MALVRDQGRRVEFRLTFSTRVGANSLHDPADDRGLTTARLQRALKMRHPGLRSPCGLSAATYRACEAERAALVAAGLLGAGSGQPQLAPLCSRF